MRIATWNVNSIRARLQIVCPWLADRKPDVLLLQETKGEADTFPFLEFEALGYKTELLGQKSYNGVAILSRHPIENVLRGLPGDEGDQQARYIEATIMDVRIASLYLPNGNPVDSDKYPYKLNWMKRLHAHASSLLATEQQVVLGGDYNVLPAPQDVYDPAAWEKDALFLPETRRAFRSILGLGYTDAFRALHPDAKDAYSFWDYQAGCWQKNLGLRIDHFLLSPEAVDRMAGCEIDKEPRGAEKASDHTPVVLTLL